MRATSLLYCLLLWTTSGALEAQSGRVTGVVGTLTRTPGVVTAADGRTMEVESGALLVPESRARPTERVISIPYYRLRSTAAEPGTPIFLLAGGPGSSWIDQVENEANFDEVQFYRSNADVVLFDQRGAGHSLPNLGCDEHVDLPAELPLRIDILAAAIRDKAAACRDRWLAAGVDLQAYTTAENAADVDALRAALGYDRVTLIGGSYGSHLALALMRYFPESIERVVMHGIEGPDHTWDSPSGRLRAFNRHAAAVEASGALGARMPRGGLLEALRSVITRLDADPVLVRSGDGPDASEVVVDGTTVRLIAGFQAGQRNRPLAWPRFILDMYEGDYSLPAEAALAFREYPVDDPMHFMMDCSSGISPARAARYGNAPARGLLGDINWEYAELCGTWRAPDLGAGFRAPLRSAIPTVIVHGTWDTSTPIENAREVVATLENGQLVEVITGNHGALYNLYSHWEPIFDLLGAFLRGEEVRFPAEVRLQVEFDAPHAEP
ncbi:MAG: alpha/beta fold hydrolase [Gemmatimonadota bacterium]